MFNVITLTVTSYLFSLNIGNLLLYRGRVLTHSFIVSKSEVTQPWLLPLVHFVSSGRLRCGSSDDNHQHFPRGSGELGSSSPFTFPHFYCRSGGSSAGRSFPYLLLISSSDDVTSTHSETTSYIPSNKAKVRWDITRLISLFEEASLTNLKVRKESVLLFSLIGKSTLFSLKVRHKIPLFTPHLG